MTIAEKLEKLLRREGVREFLIPWHISGALTETKKVHEHVLCSKKLECLHPFHDNFIDAAYVEKLERIVRAVPELWCAMRYGANEMKYRIHQIEGGYTIPMTGEMHVAVKNANEAEQKLMSALERALQDGLEDEVPK